MKTDKRQHRISTRSRIANSLEPQLNQNQIKTCKQLGTTTRNRQTNSIELELELDLDMQAAWNQKQNQNYTN